MSRTALIRLSALGVAVAGVALAYQIARAPIADPGPDPRQLRALALKLEEQARPTPPPVWETASSPMTSRTVAMRRQTGNP